MTRLRAWLEPALPGWVGSRLGMAGMSFFAAVFAEYVHQPKTNPLHVWYQWDTGWYLTISQAGYFNRDSANFFPLFPGLVAAGTALAGHARAPAQSNTRLAVALVISSLATLVALAAVAALAREVGAGLEERAVLALVAFPTAFFLTAAYTESLFLALATGALVLSRRRQWLPAAACAVLAGLTRSTAIVLVVPLAWEALRWGRTPAGWARAGALAAAPVLGIALFAAYLGYRFGDPLLFAHTQTTEWHHQAMAPWATAALIAGHLAHHQVGLLPIDIALWAGALAVVLAAARRLPLSWTLLSLGVVAFAVAAPIPHSNDVIASAGRYLLAATPIFPVLAGWMRASRYFEAAYLVCGLLLQAGLLITFLLGGPVL